MCGVTVLWWSMPTPTEDMRRRPALTHECEQALGRAAQAGDTKARNRLVEANMGAALAAARAFGCPSEIERGDLEQAALLGLIEAVDAWEVDAPDAARFATAAQAWMLAAMRRECRAGRTVRLSADDLAKRRAVECMRAVLGTSATREEIAVRLGATFSAVRRSGKSFARVLRPWTARDVADVDAMPVERPVALDARVDDEGVPRVETLADPRPVSADLRVGLFAGLSDRERVALTESALGKTQREIAAMLGVGQQRASEIIRGARESIRA